MWKYDSYSNFDEKINTSSQFNGVFKDNLGAFRAKVRRKANNKADVLLKGALDGSLSQQKKRQPSKPPEVSITTCVVTLIGLAVSTKFCNGPK